MPRNVARPLSADDHKMQIVNHQRLMRIPTGETVSLTYVKRNGQVSSSTGKIGFFSGVPGKDTGSVTIETEDKGPRTINLHNITVIR